MDKGILESALSSRDKGFLQRWPSLALVLGWPTGKNIVFLSIKQRLPAQNKKYNHTLFTIPSSISLFPIYDWILGLAPNLSFGISIPPHNNATLECNGHILLRICTTIAREHFHGAQSTKFFDASSAREEYRPCTRFASNPFDAKTGSISGCRKRKSLRYWRAHS